MRLDPGAPALAADLAVAKWLVTTAGHRHYNVGTTTTPSIAIGMTLLEYGPGTAMRRHYDNQHEGKSSLGAAALGLPPLGRTLYACCLYLTDPSQYVGGELNIDDHPPMRPGQGDAVFIRGDVLHSVDEITHGTRHVIKVVVMHNHDEITATVGAHG